MKVVDCLISKTEVIAAPNPNFDGHALLAALPHEPKYHGFEPLYRAMFINLLQHYALMAYNGSPVMKEFFSTSDITDAAQCFGGQLGTCVATKGFDEIHKNPHIDPNDADAPWFSQLVKGLVDSQSDTVAQLGDSQIDNLMKQFNLPDDMKAQIHSMVHQIVNTFGVPFVNHAIECLFDDTLDVKSGCETSSGSAASTIQDSLVPMPHTLNLKHYKQSHGKGKEQGKVSVHVEVDVE